MDAAKIAILVAGIITFLSAVPLVFLINRSIAQAINRIIESLALGSEQVATASGQIFQSSQLLAEGASEQVTSIEETSSSMQKMTSMASQKTQNTIVVNRILVQEVGPNFEAINQRAGQTSESFSSKVNAGRQTAIIIETIDDIAFPTNLLSPNTAKKSKYIRE